MFEEDLEVGPFYENKGDLTYGCDLTGQVCGCVTKHFRDYRDFIKGLSESGDDRLFLHSESNLCPQMGCSVYENEWLRQVQERKNRDR